jgi:hypothetical protein
LVVYQLEMGFDISNAIRKNPTRNGTLDRNFVAFASRSNSIDENNVDKGECHDVVAFRGSHPSKSCTLQCNRHRRRAANQNP